MTTTPDELMAEEWRQTHPHGVEVICHHCGASWMVSYLAGEPIDSAAIVCSGCGKAGEPR